MISHLSFLNTPLAVQSRLDRMKWGVGSFSGDTISTDIEVLTFSKRRVNAIKLRTTN